VFNSPNGRIISSIKVDTIASVIEIRTLGGQAWYLLRWVESGLVQEGWVRNINVEDVVYP
jgi:hypothetical protein